MVGGGFRRLGGRERWFWVGRDLGGMGRANRTQCAVDIPKLCHHKTIRKFMLLIQALKTPILNPYRLAYKKVVLSVVKTFVIDLIHLSSYIRSARITRCFP